MAPHRFGYFEESEMNFITPFAQRGVQRDLSTLRDMRPISADSHVAEPPNAYADNIDPKYRDRAPHIVHDEAKGDLFVVPGLPEIVPLGLIACAGIDPADRKPNGVFADLHRGGWNVKDRIEAMETDGIIAEILYPTVGMLVCNHPDYDYKHAVFEAYNRWLEEFVGGAPGKLFGVGQTAARSPEEIVTDMHKIKDAGFIGVMLPGIPNIDDYDSPIYDRVWATAVELDMPISFHILTSSNKNPAAIMSGGHRGPKINRAHVAYQPSQDLIGMFIYTGVFDRFPALKMVSVEADAGWVPHMAYRMDHKYKIQRHYMGSTVLKNMPSDYFFENVYLTFQDDYVAFRAHDLMNPKRLLWATDFPHADSTYPDSLDILAENTSLVPEDVIRDIVHNNVKELYKLPL
jgi:uncharacterized protein